MRSKLASAAARGPQQRGGAAAARRPASRASEPSEARTSRAQRATWVPERSEVISYTKSSPEEESTLGRTLTILNLRSMAESKTESVHKSLG